MYMHMICLVVAIATDCFAEDTDSLESSSSIATFMLFYNSSTALLCTYVYACICTTETYKYFHLHLCMHEYTFMYA